MVRERRTRVRDSTRPGHAFQSRHNTELLPQRPRTLVRLWLIPITDDIQRVANADNADALVVSSHGWLLRYVLYSCTVHGPASFRHSYLQLIHSPHHPSYNPLDHLNILILYNDDCAREGTQGHADTTEAERPQCPQNTRTRRSA